MHVSQKNSWSLLSSVWRNPIRLKAESYMAAKFCEIYWNVSPDFYHAGRPSTGSTKNFYEIISAPNTIIAGIENHIGATFWENPKKFSLTFLLGLSDASAALTVGFLKKVSGNSKFSSGLVKTYLNILDSVYKHREAEKEPPKSPWDDFGPGDLLPEAPPALAYEPH